MAIAGQIVLFRFPQTNLTLGKLRPALLIKPLSNNVYDDWLSCMISTKTGQEIAGLDEIISPQDVDFSQTGLKSESVFRVSRLAVVSEQILLGKIGEIFEARLTRIRQNLANWILKD
ncbi:type II toxin-antitoxin system PemK/MazF family toxin [Anabaena sp. UHCC 0451]|uniref:type II toxin-antitoxin system PemK/MazF family toxin n=1 Tax=Anabaena sp. UHCC 0451 TaxID=2055235 RepID=UPI002B1EE89D|nr:type II toxin-antitoxin system PemK/MazF family toxin [Anabaena sp. UHCC 0451]MEA5576674.1 type II toxin-antitoxin system PemK/MazF family toxin [Anabaena sp. UHCC 0451]